MAFLPRKKEINTGEKIILNTAVLWGFFGISQ
jgi:hypothetical protein